MANLGSMVLELSANVAKFEAGLNRADYLAQRSAENWNKSITAATDRISGTLVDLAVKIGAAFSIEKLIEFGKTAIDTADEVGKMAQKVGISVEALSALQVQAKLSNASTEELQVGLSKLAKNAADAASGSKQQAAAFSAIGVSVTDAAGKLKPMEVLLGDVAGKFATYKDSAAKTALAQELLGKSGANLIPYLNELGEKSLPEVIKQADEFGAVLSTKTSKQAEEFNDNITKLKIEAGGFANAVVSQLLPSLVKLTDQMVETGKTTDKYKTSSTEVATVIKQVVFALATGFEAFKLWNTTLQDFFSIGRQVFSAFGQVIQIWSETTAKAIKAAFSLDSAGLDAADKEFKDRMAGVGDGIAGAIKKANDDITQGTKDAVGNARKSYDSLLGTFSNVESGVVKLSKTVKDAPIVPNAGAIDNSTKALLEQAKAMEALDKLVTTLKGKAGDPFVQSGSNFINQMLALKQAAEAAAIAGGNVDVIIQKWQEGEEAAAKALAKTNKELSAQSDLLGRFTRDLEDQSALIGLSDRELAVATAVKKVTEEYNSFVDAGKPVNQTLEELQVGAAAAAGKFYDLKTAADLSAEAAKGWQSLWATAANGVADTFAKVLVNGGNLFAGLRDLAKQTVEQIIAYFAKLAVINPILNSIFGSGGAIGTGFSLLPTLANAGGTSGYNLSGASTLTGATNLLGSGSQGIVSDTIKSLGGIGKIASVFGAAYAGYQIGGSAGAIGLAAAAYFVPVVGWIAGAASIINSLTGGALFGTKYKPTGVSNSSLSIGDSGASIANTFQESKKKALFGGTSYKDVSAPATADQTAGAAALYNAIKSGAEAFAAQFGQSVDRLIGGTYSIATDKAGKQTFTSTVGGQAFSGETQQQFAERLQSANFLAVLDKMGLGASDFVNGLQGDADKLAAAVQDFASATQAANTDLGNGFKFMALQADATLADVMKFVEGAEAAGESLTDTYKRLAVAQTQYNQFVAQFAPQATFVDDFEAALSGVYHSMLQNIDAANQLAIAAGASGAAQTDLTNIQNVAAQQMAALVVQLEASAQSLAFSLGLTTQGSLSQITDEISKLQSKAGQTSGTTSKATKSLGEFVSAVGDVAKAADNAISLLLGNLSPLNDQQKLQIALQGLRAGTVSQEQVLGIGRNLYASSQAYTDLFNQVMHSGSGGAKASGGQGVNNAIGSYLPTYDTTDTSSGLSPAEQAKLDALLKQQAALQAAETMQQYQTLAQQIAEIASAKGETYNQILEEMGIQAADLEKGLGLKSDADLQAYITQIQATLDSGKENTASIVGALNTLPHAIAAELADIIGKVNASLPSAAGPVPVSPPPASATPPPQDGSGSGTLPGGRTLSDGDLTAMARMFGSATGEAIASRQTRSGRVAA